MEIAATRLTAFQFSAIFTDNPHIYIARARMASDLQKIDLPPAEVLRDSERRWVWVLTALKLRGTNLARVARAENIPRNTLQVAKLHPYPRAEGVIARSLGVSVQTLFPDRYDRHGVPIRKKRAPASLKVRHAAGYPQARAAE